MQAAQTQKLSMQQPSLFSRIGKVVYEKHHDASGPDNVITPIRDALARCEVLDAEIDRLSSQGTSWLTPKRLAVAGVGVALLVLGMGLWTITQQMFGSKNAIPLASYSALSPDEEAKLNKAVAEGDALWEIGVQGVNKARQHDTSPDEARTNFDAALVKYLVVVNSPQPLPDREVMARVYGRVIDTALGRTRNKSLAKEVAMKALRLDILPVVQSQDASPILEEARQALKAEEKETDEWLEIHAGDSRTATSSGNGEQPSAFEFPALDMDERYKALVNRIRPGMTREQVESILSFSDEEKENDLGEFNSQKAGQILTILTWKGDGNSKPSIVLAFINNRLSEGGTPGYDITKGFNGK